MSGKTAVEWKRHFYIKIPDAIDFHILVNLASEIGQKYQEAARYRDEQHLQLAILEQVHQDKYNDAYVSVRAEHEQRTGKNLSAESCRVTASLVVKDLEEAMINQKIAKDFWAKTCDTLTELRKLLELIGKALSSDAYLEKDIIVRS